MSFLGVVIDCQAEGWARECVETSSDDGANRLPAHFQSIIAGLVAFCNGHMLASLNNQVLLVAGGGIVAGAQKKLFDNNDEEADSLFENGASQRGGLLELIEHRLKQTLTASFDRREDRNGVDEGSLQNQLNPSQGSVYSSAISLCLCAYRQFKKRAGGGNAPGQIVIVNFSRHLSAEQSQLMSLWFSARQLGAVINVVSMAFHGQRAVPVLQQCDITGGIHLLLENASLLGHTLTKYFLISSSPDFPDGFEMFPLRKPLEIDYRASCHCGHGALVDLGWVCSACLAVHCAQPRKCVGCGTQFSVQGVEEREN